MNTDKSTAFNNAQIRSENTTTNKENPSNVTMNALSVNEINLPMTQAMKKVNESTPQTQVACHQLEKTTQVLLSTAVVFAFDSTGAAHHCRVLLDCGAQSNFISEHMCQLLRLKRHKISTSVIGVNQSTSQVQHSVNITIQSRFNNYTCDLEFLVLNHITNNLPNLHICDIKAWNIPDSIKLADSSFNIPGKIDILLGSEIFFQLLCVRKVKLSDDLPILQKTVFDWIVAGKVINSNPATMIKVDSNLVTQPNYFLPHHAVLKPTSTTIKLRMVFDGSFKTSNNTSLNEHLLVGPSTQNDLFSIILRFRKHPIVMTCDIAKMYRQVQSDQKDQRFQHIIWRDSRDCPISIFRLTTVTYGTTSAPYLATKCLQ